MRVERNVLCLCMLLVCMSWSCVRSEPSTSEPGGGFKKPSKPVSWICLTTAGGANVNGGRVNYSWCKNDDNTNTSGNGTLFGGSNGKHHSMQWLGWLGIIIACVFFGSNFIPIKKFDTGDGVFFQWIVCIGIWLVGLVVNAILYQPPFFLPTILGGILWTTGNMMVVPIVKMIGLTMGLTVWGVTNMLAGWTTGRFILKQELSCYDLNYGGVAAIIVSVVILAFVKSEGKKAKTSEELRSGNNSPLPDEKSPLMVDQNTSLQGSLGERVIANDFGSIQKNSDQLTFSRGSNATSPSSMPSPEQDADYSWVDRLGKWPKRVLGFVLSLISGLFYGYLFLPVQLMKNCDDNAHSCNDIDYIFSLYTGILLTSTFYFVVYSAFKRNSPAVYPKVILPGLISGIMWGIAMVGWFMANDYLTMEVAFPMITAGPGFVSSLYGIILYREIKGWLNLTLYFSALIVCIGGLVMDALSRSKVNC